MQILIARTGKPYGPYTLDQIQTYLASGEVQGSDLAWHEGLPSWVHLAQISGVRLPQVSTPLPPPPVTPIKQAPLLTSTLQTTDKKPAFNFKNVVKGCLGCFGIYVVGMLFIAACIWIFGGSSDNPTSSTDVVKAPVSHINSSEQKKQKIVPAPVLRKISRKERRARMRAAAFDVPSLLGKKISYLREILGHPDEEDKDEETRNASLGIDNAGMMWTKKRWNLLVHYKLDDKRVYECFISPGDDSTTKDKAGLLQASNVEENSSRYAVKFIGELGSNENFMGVEVKPMTADIAAEEKQKANANWAQATGHLWEGTKLYFGAGHGYVGQIIEMNDNYTDPLTGSSFRGLKLRYPDGNEEWKDRDAIISNDNWMVDLNQK